MLALTPKDKSLQDCKIAVQRLKYQRSSGDFDRLAAMTGNALGRWGRLGAAIDVCRSKTAGPFRRKGLSDLMAGLMLVRSEEHTSELQSLMRSSYAVFCLEKNKKHKSETDTIIRQQFESL